MNSNTNTMKLLIDESRERLKELECINTVSAVLAKERNLKSALRSICAVIPGAYQYPEATAVRIRYGGMNFESDRFTRTPWMQIQSFETPHKETGCIEVAYLKEFKKAYEGPFLREERNLLVNLASLIAGKIVRAVVDESALRSSERDEQQLIHEDPLLAFLAYGRFARIEESYAFPYPRHFED